MPTKVKSNPSLKGMHIVVVESTQDTRDYLTDQLQMEGAQVDVFASATTALSTLKAFKKPPDLVISGLKMPGKDGYEFIIDLRRLALEKKWRVPTIAFSALAPTSLKQRALELGFDRFIEKPLIDETELIQLIQSLTSRNKKFSASN